MLMNTSKLAMNILLVIVLCITVAIAFPRQRRQSFFRCNGWGAGCTNLAYSDTKPLYNGVYRRVGSTSQPRGHHANYLFTSGSSWSVIGKRYGQPNTRKLLSSILFSSDLYERLIRRLMIKGKRSDMKR